VHRTHQALDKHVGDSTDSDNEEKEDGELEEGEVEEEIDENPQQKDDAKENNRETNSSTDSINEQDPNNDPNSQPNLGSQKFRRRDYHPSQQQQQQQQQSRLNNSTGQQDKRNKHELRRKRRHSGEDRDDRNRKLYKRGRFRGGAYPDHPEDVEEEEMIGPAWSSRGPNRGQRKHPSDNPSNENSEPNHSMDSSSTSNNTTTESKNEQSINGDEPSGSINDPIDEETTGSMDDKQDRNSRTKSTKTNPSSNSMTIESRGRRYYEGNPNLNNNRRGNDRDRSSWQDRSSGNSGNNNPNNSRFRSDMNSNGPPLCKFFMDNRCAKGNDCQFSHDYKPPKRTEVCKYYVQNKGYCQKNDNCPYLHGEFPCKFFHTRTNCSQGDRCIFSHDPITNEDIRIAFERCVNDSDDMNRQNRNNANNNNLHHNNNPSSGNYDVIPGTSLLLPPPPPSIAGSFTDPNNFSTISNLMDLFRRQNGPLPNTSSIDSLNATTTTAADINGKPSQSSPPMQRNNVYNDTLMTDKSDIDESNNGKNISSTNSTSPTPSSSSSTTTLSTTTSSNDNNSTSLATSNANTSTITTPTTATNNNNNSSACPLPLPPQINNANITLPSPFGRLPAPNLVPTAATLLPPPPPGLFPLGSLQTGRVPFILPPNHTLPLPLASNTLIDVELIRKAAIAAANAAVASNFSNPNPQPLSPQLGRDIDERDRQSSNTITGDIDERPSDAFNRPTNTVPNLGLFQPSNNISSNASSSTIPVTSNDDPMKNKTVQDLFRTTKPTATEALPSSTTSNTSAGPSFDFISMLEQLKQQPKATQSADDALEIRSSANPNCVYILRPVYVAFKPYQIPDRLDSADPRVVKYEEKMKEWLERTRLEQYKHSSFSSMTHNYSQPVRSQAPPPSTSMIDSNSSRDPRLLRNTVTTSKIGIPILPTPPFV